MTELTTEERILNGFLRVILDSALNAAERQAAAASLRSGRLTNCLLAVLEFSDEKRAENQPAAPLVDASPRSAKDIAVPSKKPIRNGSSAVLTPRELFQLVRKRKVSKTSLMEIVGRLNSGIVLGVDDDASMREILEMFRKVSSDAEWITLTRAVSGEIVSDSYLNRILGR